MWSDVAGLTAPDGAIERSTYAWFDSSAAK
jgi:hypothetical protein